jgi:Fur family transcriptional regulator, stress-responsive regulator
MSDLLERLREREWRFTAQRRAVVEVLAGEHVHMSADAIHSRAQDVLPEISLATVYNTLNELVAMGEILEVAAGTGPKRYDPNARTPHQHLVCTNCGLLRDVFDAPEPSLALSDADASGFVLTGVDVVYEGLCPVCAGAHGVDAAPVGASA